MRATHMYCICHKTQYDFLTRITWRKTWRKVWAILRNNFELHTCVRIFISRCEHFISRITLEQKKFPLLSIIPAGLIRHANPIQIPFFASWAATAKWGKLHWEGRENLKTRVSNEFPLLSKYWGNYFCIIFFPGNRIATPFNCKLRNSHFMGTFPHVFFQTHVRKSFWIFDSKLSFFLWEIEATCRCRQRISRTKEEKLARR